MGSVIIYIILFILLLYPTDEVVKKANTDLSPILNDPGDMEVGFGFRLTIQGVR